MRLQWAMLDVGAVGGFFYSAWFLRGSVDAQRHSLGCHFQAHEAVAESSVLQSFVLFLPHLDATCKTYVTPSWRAGLG